MFTAYSGWLISTHNTASSLIVVYLWAVLSERSGASPHCDLALLTPNRCTIAVYSPSVPQMQINSIFWNDVLGSLMKSIAAITRLSFISIEIYQSHFSCVGCLLAHLAANISYFTLNRAVHSHSTRNCNSLHVSSVQSTFGKRSIKFKGPMLWNNHLHHWGNPSIKNLGS